ncbi:ras-related protein Rab-24-like [Limulus polyphemus]|uniref:Ras-related protein Rab-24-like n=1 Tax=Limulus polyphemus TaxID=6850 RepID=A0ABM1T4Q3_LIMPO|nr:ras-related protein Rab-24-like [Limulus polyphemus]XP_022250859.1 ras-related protein Rab-24-like [Limulus polyphemus]
MSRVDLKVVLLGKEYGGKTSLVERYLYDRFKGSAPYQNTIGAAFGAKKIYFDNRQITMGVWNCKIYLCGTKKDLVQEDRTMRKIDYHITTDYADEMGAELYETSSKTGECVEELFTKITAEFVKKYLPPVKEKEEELMLDSPVKKYSFCC